MSSKQKIFIPLILAIIFIGPMVAAWISYSKGWFLNEHKVNHGQLLNPPIAVSSLLLSDKAGTLQTKQLRGKWWLIYLTDHACDQLCQRHLYSMRQIRQATGKDRDRIELAIISSKVNQESFNDWLKQRYPGMHSFFIPEKKISQLNLPIFKKLALTNSSFYLVDPLGNIMMFYSPDVAPKGILKDLERVLKVSQIG